MATAREIDRVELDLVRRGLAFFHVAGAGHEATACLARHLTPDDWLHGVHLERRVGIAHREPMVGNAHPTFAADCDSASVGRLAKPSEASDGLEGRPTEPLAAPSPKPNHAHSARPAIFASRPSCVLGGRVVTTAEIASKIPGWTAAEAIKRTGVERRHWIAEGETVVSLATQAAAQLIDQMSWGAGKPLPLSPGEGREEGGSHLAELPKISAICRNLAWLALPTFGEAWHNNHHAFPTSARHGLEWWQLDITYLALVMLRATGLISNLRLPPTHFRPTVQQGISSNG